MEIYQKHVPTVPDFFTTNKLQMIFFDIKGVGLDLQSCHCWFPIVFLYTTGLMTATRPSDICFNAGGGGRNPAMTQHNVVSK